MFPSSTQLYVMHLQYRKEVGMELRDQLGRTQEQG